jgi:hypothetical protein
MGQFKTFCQTYAHFTDKSHWSSKTRSTLFNPSGPTAVSQGDVWGQYLSTEDRFLDSFYLYDYK